MTSNFIRLLVTFELIQHPVHDIKICSAVYDSTKVCTFKIYYLKSAPTTFKKLTFDATHYWFDIVRFVIFYCFPEAVFCTVCVCL